MISTSRRATRPRPTATCVVCGRTISVSGFPNEYRGSEIERHSRGGPGPQPSWSEHGPMITFINNAIVTLFQVRN